MRREHYIKDALQTLREGRQLNFTIPVEAPYLEHTGPVRFTRPAPSTGMRKQPEKNLVAKRGTVVHLSANQEMGYQGSIEMNALLINQVTYDVAEFREEYPKIPYADKNDKAREHTFDHWLRLRDGTRIVVSAKPLLHIKRTGLKTTMREIKPFVCPTYADEIHLLSDYNVTDDAAATASHILRSRRTPIGHFVCKVREITQNMSGSFYLGDLAALGRRVEAYFREALGAHRRRPSTAGFRDGRPAFAQLDRRSRLYR